MKKLLLITLCLNFFQSFSNNPLGGWLMYFGKTEINETKYFINYDVQFRNHELNSYDLNQLIFRGAINYNLFSNLSFGAGYGLILSEKVNEPNQPFSENRLYQDIVSNQKIETTSVRHRFRFEQRFIENQDFKSRLRYQLNLDIPIYKNIDKNRNFYANIYNEVFLNTDATTRKNNAFDRNRLYFGTGLKFNNNTAIQLGWMNQMLQKQSYQQMMFSIHHNLNI